MCLLVAVPSLRAASWNELGPIRELGPGITPGIAVDRAGAIHVVHMHDGAIYYRRGAGDGRFAAAEVVPAPEGAANYNSPHVICDDQGTVHLVFERDFTQASRKAWYTNRQAGVWKKPLLAIEQPAGRRVNYPRMAVDESAAYVAGFIGGGSAVAKIIHLSSAPVVAKTAETPLWAAHPLLRKDEVLLFGRAGSSGHKLQRYTHDLERRGEPLLFSRGTPSKTGEPTAALIDEAGVVHAVGTTGSPAQVLWYTTSTRAAANQDVILGPELGHGTKEYTFPVIARDAHGLIYVSFRDHTSGEPRLTMIDGGAKDFAKPVTVGPAITRRLRWNAHLAPAPNGGVHVVWDAGGRVYLRAVGVAAH